MILFRKHRQTLPFIRKGDEDELLKNHENTITIYSIFNCSDCRYYVERLRGNQTSQGCRTKDIHVIFITSKNGEEDETKGFEIGAVDYITKPFSLSIVKARLRTHLKI